MLVGKGQPQERALSNRGNMGFSENQSVLNREILGRKETSLPLEITRVKVERIF